MSTLRIIQPNVDDLVFSDANICDELVREFPQGLPQNTAVWRDGELFEFYTVDEFEELNAASHVTVEVRPSDPVTATIAVVSLLVGGYSAYQAYKANKALRNLQQDSSVANNRQVSKSNNSLTGRGNGYISLGQRIPHTLGSDRCYPDYLGTPLRFYDNHIEREESLMCVGVGGYHIDYENIKEGEANVAKSGTHLAFYAPNTSPNIKSKPEHMVGSYEPKRTYLNVVSDIVNGQKLDYYDSSKKESVEGCYLERDNSRGSSNDFYIKPGVIVMPKSYVGGISGGDVINLSCVLKFKIGVQSYPVTSAQSLIYMKEDVDLSGTYNVRKVVNNKIYLENASSVNSNWSNLVFSGGVWLTPAYTSCTFSASGDFLSRVDGGTFPLQVNGNQLNKIYINVVAPNGLYKLAQSQGVHYVYFLFSLSFYDSQGSVLGQNGNSEYIEGSRDSQSLRARTVKFDLSKIPLPAGTEKIGISVRRMTPPDTDFQGTVVEDCVWESLYLQYDIGDVAFGDCTTVYSYRVAQSNVLRSKSNKLSFPITTKLPGFDNKDASLSVFNLLNYALLNKYLCNYKRGVDLSYVRHRYLSYFGGKRELEGFGYTLDQQSQNAEGVIRLLASVAGLNVYREGDAIKLNFERAQDTPLMVFNHTNITPNSMKFSTVLASNREKSGVSFHWRNPEGIEKIIHIPPNSDNPTVIKSSGVRNKVQANMLAKRAYARQQLQHTTVEFTALEEASFLLPGDLIQVQDVTYLDSNSGTITQKNGLVIDVMPAPNLSQSGDLWISIQGALKVQRMRCYTKDENGVELPLGKLRIDREPNEPIRIDSKSSIKTTFTLSTKSDIQSSLYIVEENTGAEKSQRRIKAINYADYYSGDYPYPEPAHIEFDGLDNNSSVSYDRDRPYFEKELNINTRGKPFYLEQRVDGGQWKLINVFEPDYGSSHEDPVGNHNYKEATLYDRYYSTRWGWPVASVDELNQMIIRFATGQYSLRVRIGEGESSVYSNELSITVSM